MTTGTIDRKGATYDAVAMEYYDPNAHPTCADFRELSDLAILSYLRSSFFRGIKILEVGAGRSSVSQFMSDRQSIQQLTLLDISAEMLSYSRRWFDEGAQCMIGDARQTQLPDASFDAIIGSLGDPYNVGEFWIEACRLLRRVGSCLVTTPAPSWVNKFRDRQSLNLAEFLVGGRDTVNLPSYTYDSTAQEELITASGMRISMIKYLYSSQLTSIRSIKTTVSDTYHGPVVACYVAEAAAL